jgi:predicted transcriptional regulator
MKVTQVEQSILKELFKSSNGLLVYTIYGKFRLTPAEVFKFLQKFSTADIIKQEEEKISLTEKGKKFLLFRKKAPSNSKDKFSNIPEKFLSANIKINEFYTPKIAGLSKDILSLQHNERDGSES